MTLKNEQEETITSREEKGFLVIMSMKKKRKNYQKLVDRARIPGDKKETVSSSSYCTTC